jgi:hypothetical protein
LSGVQAVSKDYETLGELSVPLDAHNRSFRARSRNQCRNGRCSPVVVRSLSPTRL